MSATNYQTSVERSATYAAPPHVLPGRLLEHVLEAAEHLVELFDGETIPDPEELEASIEWLRDVTAVARERAVEVCK